jgi:alginate O-acetyltransferase complex protein AlgI
MSFVEVEFFYFLPVALLVYWCLPRRAAWQNACLLALSWLFYATWHWKLLALLIGGGLLDYAVTRYLDRDATAVPTARRRMALGLSLACSLGALGFFKYEGFFAESFNALMSRVGLELSVPVLQILLPLGISFFTLQRIGYVVDVYLGRMRASRSLLEVLLFAGYFPQLTAGPIARGSELLTQLHEPRRLLPAAIATGAGEMLVGFVLKAWAADSIGVALVDPVFAQPGHFGTAAHWAGVIGYTAQVFGDFAGYSLIAIGCSRLFGIELPVNFDFPFLSRSLPELWRRWHITLNRWLFDYIYTPLATGGSWFRGRFDACLLVVFLASGLWHGAAATFVFWGLLHGLGMMAHRHWDERYKQWCRRDRWFVSFRKSLLYAALAWFATQMFFVLSMVPFRAPSFQAAADYAAALVHSAGSGWPAMTPFQALYAAGGIAFIVVYHVAQLGGLRRVGAWWQSWPAPVKGFAFGLAIAWLMIVMPVSSSTFIYRQF